MESTSDGKNKTKEKKTSRWGKQILRVLTIVEEYGVNQKVNFFGVTSE